MRRIPVGAVVAATAVFVGCHTITEELLDAAHGDDVGGSGNPGHGASDGRDPGLDGGHHHRAEADGNPGTNGNPGAGPAPRDDAATRTPAPDGDACPRPAPFRWGRQCRGMRQPPPGPGGHRQDQDPHPRGQQVHAGRDAARRGRRVLPEDRLHRRPEPVPGSTGGRPGASRVRGLRGGPGGGHGRAGPTWTRNSGYCKGESSGGCENHPDNQYLLWAYKGGYYEACVKGGTCGSVDVDR